MQHELATLVEKTIDTTETGESWRKAINKTIGKWCEEKAVKIMQSYGGFGSNIAGSKNVNEILCISEKTLEEVFQEQLHGVVSTEPKGGRVHFWTMKKSPKQLAQIAEEHSNKP